MGRGRGWGLVVAASVAAVAVPSAAQEPPEVPVVRIASVSPVVASFSCGDIDATVTPGEVMLERSGDLAEGLSVTFDSTGSVYTSPGELTFFADERTTSLPFASGSIVPSGPIVVTLVDGEDYDLGEPATATVPIDSSAVERGCPPYVPPGPPDPPVVEPTYSG